MNITTILIISGSAIAIYIAFLVIGFSLKGKNIKAQNLEDKNQIKVLIKRSTFYKMFIIEYLIYREN